MRRLKASSSQESRATKQTSPDLASSAGPRDNGFETRDLLLSIRGIAKLLSTVPGSKTMVFLSAGFELVVSAKLIFGPRSRR